MFPNDLQTVKVRFGEYLSVMGLPESTRVQIDVPRPVTYFPTGSVIFRGVTLNGVVNDVVELPATDAENTSPRGYVYRITVDGATKFVSLPAAVPEVNYANLIDQQIDEGTIHFPPTHPGPRGPRGARGERGPQGATGPAPDMTPVIEAVESSASRAEAAESATALMRDEVQVISGLTGEDSAVALLVDTPTSDTAATLSAKYAAAPGANLARVISRARSGQPIKVVAIGDSILEGTTVAADGGTLGINDTLSRVRAAIAARFNTTATQANHALSGHTVAIGPLSQKWSAAVAEEGDLYLVDYGTNDLSGDLTTLPVPGYKMDNSIAGLERLFRRIRSDVPAADIAFLIANPYLGGDTGGNNPAKKSYNRRVRDVCALYGVELIDGYSPFIALGDYSALMADTTHPNSAGHQLLADAVMSHLPATFRGSSNPPAALASTGLANPQNVDTTIGDTGASYVLTPTAPMWVEAGTWATSGSARTSSTIGSSITGTGNFTELYVMLSTLTADGLRATLTVDGVDVFTNTALTTGKQGNYWVPLATDLTPGDHTYELTITGGTAKVYRVGWLAGAPVGAAFTNPYIRQQQLAPFTTATTTVPTDGATLYLYGAGAGEGMKRIDRPAGWASMGVSFQGQVDMRTLATTTTPRQVYVTVRHAGSIIYTQYAEIPATAVNLRSPWFTFTTPPVAQSSDQQPVSLEVRAMSADKTGLQVLAYSLGVTMVRTG